MSKLPPSTLKFTWFAAIILLAASFLSVAGLPQANDWRQSQANRLGGKAAGESGSAAESDLRLARLYEPRDDSLRVKLAQAQIADGHLNGAISTLKSSKSEAGESLRGETQMSLDEYDSAITSFQALVSDFPSDSARVDLAKAQIEAGKYQSAKATLAKVNSDQAYVLGQFCNLLLNPAVASSASDATGAVASSDALQAVARAQSSKLALAQELYAYGLPNASQSVLMQLDGSTTTEWLLRADIALGRPTPDFATAITDLNTGLKLDPSNVELRTLLQKTYEQQGNTAAASAQHALLLQTEGQ